MRKFIFIALVFVATGSIQACNSSNGDRSKPGSSDTVGTSTGSVKDSTNGLKDTLKH